MSSVEGIQHGDHPVQSKGERVLGYLGLNSGSLEASLKSHSVTQNRATGPKGTQWKSGLAVNPAEEKSVQPHPSIGKQSA